MVNSYVDLDDYETPIKYFIDDTFYWETLNGIRHKIDTEVQKNGGNFQDSLIQLIQPSTKYYYSLNTAKEQMVQDDVDFFTIYFRTDQNNIMYYRKVYSIGDLLGQIGGFFEVLSTAGAFFTFIIADRLITAALASRIYQVRNDDYDKRNDDSDNRNDDLPKDSRDIKKNTQKSTNQNSQFPPIHETNKFRIDNHWVTTDNFGVDEESSDTIEAKKELMSRKRFKYNWKNVFHFFVWFGWVKTVFTCNKSSDQKLTNHQIWNIARERIKKEMDVGELIIAMRNLKLLMAIILSKNQKLALELQRSHVLEPENKIISNNKIANDNGIKSWADGFDLVGMLHSKDSNNSILAKGQIDEMLSGLNIRSSSADQKLYQSLLTSDLQNSKDPSTSPNNLPYLYNSPKISDNQM